MSLQEINGPVRQWDEAGLKSCTALLFKVEGSSPRPPGSRLAVNERGGMAGFISLGCVEGDVREHVRNVLDGGLARVLHYGAADELSPAVGLSCGGAIDVLLTRHDANDPAWRALAGMEPPVGLLLTRITAPESGRRLFVGADGVRHGSLGDRALDDEALSAAQELDATRLLTLSAGTAVLAEKLAPPQRLLIVGATPVAAALCKLAAAVGLDVVVVDPRRAFANEHLFPGARRIVLSWPEEGLTGAGAGPADFVAVVSHDPKLDLPGLKAALRAGCRYVGLLGGRGTQAARRAALRQEGFTESDLARLHGPIGLRIGSVTPDEIAIAALAEIITLYRGA